MTTTIDRRHRERPIPTQLAHDITARIWPELKPEQWDATQPTAFNRYTVMVQEELDRAAAAAEPSHTTNASEAAHITPNIIDALDAAIAFLRGTTDYPLHRDDSAELLAWLDRSDVVEAGLVEAKRALGAVQGVRL